MDIQKYIDSGILENYALGLVSEQEVNDIEKNLIQFPELKAELNKIEEALVSYAQAKAMPMPKGLADSIVQSIEQLDQSPSSSPTSDNTKPAQASSGGNNVLGVVLGISLLGSLFGSYFLYQQKEDVQQKLTTAQAETVAVNDRMTTLQFDCDEKDGTIVRLQEQIAILKNPAYKPITMEGTPNAPAATRAIVYYNPAAGDTRLDIGNLPAPPSDRDYQLWAIVDGTPTDMGVIDLSTGFVKVEHIRNPQAFAVTLETKGGNPTPNLDALFLIGNV